MKIAYKLSVSDGVYTLFKKAFLLFDTALLKCFVYSRVGILDYDIGCSCGCENHWIIVSHGLEKLKSAIFLLF